MTNVMRVTPIYSAEQTNLKKTKRVCAYCRVSTDKYDQVESYEMQKRYYTRLIQSNPEWTYAGIYADEGLSGTNALKRPQFQQMIEDGIAGKIDLILTKSISRFSRNTVDCIQYVRKLKLHKVEVQFEKEKISSMDPTSELIFTLMAAIAQDESRSISDNMRWTYKKRFEQGHLKMGSNQMLGYDLSSNGELIPNKDAWIVKRIFDEFIQGKSMSEIARGLNDDCIQTLRKKNFVSLSIARILQNEKYCGNALLQKRPPKDFLTKNPDPNIEYVSYFIEDHHEAIVSIEKWNKVNDIIEKQSQDRNEGVYSTRKNNNPFYGRLICGKCASPYIRRTATHRNDVKTKYWNCRSRQSNGPKGCSAPNISEGKLEKACAQALGLDVFNEESFLLNVKLVKIFETNHINIIMGDGVEHIFALKNLI